MDKIKNFDKWYMLNVKQTIGNVAARAAWDYQQEEINKLERALCSQITDTAIAEVKLEEAETDITACVKLIAIQETKLNEQD